MLSNFWGQSQYSVFPPGGIADIPAPAETSHKFDAVVGARGVRCDFFLPAGSTTRVLCDVPVGNTENMSPKFYRAVSTNTCIYADMYVRRAGLRFFF